MIERPSAMSADRFAVLAGIYGGQIARWPQAEQAAAAAFVEAGEGRAILQEARRLDALLDLYVVPAPSAHAHVQIFREATQRLARQRRIRFEVGLAGVGFAGMIAGLIMATVLMPAASFHSQIFDANTTAFGDIAPDGDMLDERN